MAIQQRLMGSGLAPQAAINIAGDVSSGLTATGTNQATALTLTSAINEFTTVASSTGALLPPMSPGDAVYVYNGGSNTLSVYPQGTNTIANGSASAAFSVGTNKGCYFIQVSSTRAGVLLSA